MGLARKALGDDDPLIARAPGDPDQVGDAIGSELDGGRGVGGGVFGCGDELVGAKEQGLGPGCWRLEVERGQEPSGEEARLSSEEVQEA